MAKVEGSSPSTCLMASPRWKPRAAKKNRKLLRALHLEHAECALLSNECGGKIELHHVLGGAYGREDHIGNLVRLCSAHHKAITENDVETRMALGLHILRERLDVMAYVRQRLGDDAGNDWLRRRLFIDL